MNLTSKLAMQSVKTTTLRRSTAGTQFVPEINSKTIEILKETLTKRCFYFDVYVT